MDYASGSGPPPGETNRQGSHGSDNGRYDSYSGYGGDSRDSFSNSKSMDYDNRGDYVRAGGGDAPPPYAGAEQQSPEMGSPPIQGGGGPASQVSPVSSTSMQSTPQEAH